MDVINLDLEDFEYRQVTVPLEECCLIYQWSNAALRTRTHVHKDFDACFILGPQARGSIDGTELHPYALGWMIWYSSSSPIVNLGRSMTTPHSAGLEV